MTFEHPEGLWLLALGVPIVVFHFYKGRIRKLSVPTLLFWEQVLVEEERRTALKRLRHYASLLLNLLALFLLTSAVAGPSVPGVTRAPARYAIVVDNSASMGTVEAEGRTRLSVAIDRARDFLGSLAYGDRVAVHDGGGVRVPFTSDHDRVARELVVPGAGSGDDVGSRVRTALAAGRDVTAILFTDVPPRGVDDLVAAGRLRVVSVGSVRDNSGWVKGSPVRRPGEKKVTLWLTLENFGAGPAERKAVLSFNGRRLAERPVPVAAGGRAEVEWGLDPSAFRGSGLEEGGGVEVRLEPPDALPLDDAAHFILPALVPPQVIVFHPGKRDDFLMKALSVLQSEGIVGGVFEAPVERYVRGKLGERELVIFDRAAPAELPEKGGILVLGASRGRAVERPTLVDWDAEAPVNRLVDYGGLAVRRARLVEGAPLLQAAEGTLAAGSARGGRAVVEFGFSLEESDLPLRPAFIMMLRNWAEWASFQGLRSFATEYRVGEPLRPARRLWIEEGEVSFVSSRRVDRVAVKGGVPEVSPPAPSGFVRIEGGDRWEAVAANLFDRAESDLRPPEGTPVALGPPPPAPWHARIPYAVLAAVLVLVILVGEWWLYHRGMI